MIKKLLLATCLFIAQFSVATAVTAGDPGADRASIAAASAVAPLAADGASVAASSFALTLYAEDDASFADGSLAEDGKLPSEDGELSSARAEDQAKADKPSITEPVRRIGIVTLQSGNLNVRSGPSLDHEIIGKLPNGSVVTVLETYDEWALIAHENGANKTAYVSKPYLRLFEAGDKESGKVVVLDPGHGGRDPGAVLKDGTREIDIVWDYAIKAKAALEEAGYIVHLTREKDRSCMEYTRNHDDLACRIELAEKVGGDIFISLHADANPVSSFRGTVTFYNARSDYDGKQNPFPEESKRLAQLVQSHVQPAMGSRDRGIENKNYYVNRMSTMPSVLVELAVLTNKNDLKLLKSSKRQDAVAEALVKAVDLYFQTAAIE